MKKNIYPIIVLVIVVVACVLWSFLNMKQPAKYTGPVEKVTIGTISHEALTLLFIAQHNGYFLENGIDLVIKEYTITTDTFGDFFTGVLDMATVTEYSATRKLFDRQDFKIIASLDEGKVFSIIGRRDHHIASAEDLKYKRIGVTRGLSTEYILDDFLVEHDMSFADVTIVDLGRNEIVDNLVAGTIDVGVIWDPLIQKLQSILKENAVVFETSLEKDFNMLVLVRNDVIASRPVVAERFLRALVQAEQFTQEHPTEAQNIMMEKLGYDAEYMTRVWTQHSRRVTLKQKLLSMMEDEARWTIRRKLTTQSQIPNYLYNIYIDALAAVKPDAMEIIH